MLKVLFIFAALSILLPVSSVQTYAGSFNSDSDEILAVIRGSFLNAKTLKPEAGVFITFEETLVSVTSGADGKFVIKDIPMGEHWFRVKKSGLADTRYKLTIDRSPYQWDIVEPGNEGIAYPPVVTGNLRGAVYDLKTGRRIAKARIRVLQLNREIQTDAWGNFVFRDLPEGSYTFQVLALNHEATWVKLTVSPSGKGIYNFSLMPTTKGIIAGKITDVATAKPIRYVNLEIEGSGDFLSAQSEGDGSFMILGIPDGTYTVKTMHPEYSESKKSGITVVDQQTATLDFVLSKSITTGDLKGAIKDRTSGNPIVGAKIAIAGTSLNTTTNSNGIFQIVGAPAGLVHLTITAHGYPIAYRTTGIISMASSGKTESSTLDISLDAANPNPALIVTKIIDAAVGGEMTMPDDRFSMVILPGVLSANAKITLKTPVDGPRVTPGADLNMNPVLDLSGIKAIGKMTEILIEPVASGKPVPTLKGMVLLMCMYDQLEIDKFKLDEETIFPAYYNGTDWDVMLVKADEFLRMAVYNIVLCPLDISNNEQLKPIPASGRYYFILGARANANGATSLK